MTSEPRAEITTILFTDLVGSTDLVQRVGDEAAQRILESHHGLLGHLVANHGGEELQWLGDGLMAAFPSTADALRCAIAAQRSVQQARAGDRLAIRVGLNVGEILRQETGSGYFGIPVVLARRLCDHAGPGQILCTTTVAGLLAGRKAFRFEDVGALELKGIDPPVTACRVLYETETGPTPLEHVLFVGRRPELECLSRSLERATAGDGGIVLVVGEPGIGKTRLTEEFAAGVQGSGAHVLRGRCHEGDWAPPYAPFAEALAEYAKQADPEALRQDLGHYGGALAALAPQIRERVSDLPQPVPLQPDEERQRLFDAVVQFLLTIAQRTAAVLVLDDLHWADGSTIALVRHVARFVQRSRLLLVGTYRHVELDRRHPLAGALVALRREPGYERILLKGLAGDELAELVAAIATDDVPRALVDAIDQETDGNPFFIREILLHLAAEGKLHTAGDRGRTELGIDDLGIPEGVRQAIGQRLSRLSDEANRLLGTASGFGGAFRFDVAWRAAELEERPALDALDEALAAHVLHPTGDADVYDFAHALIRHTLYAELSPSRQVRLHRRIAEEMERVWTEHVLEHAAEIAEQYHLSAVLSGAERGVPHCLAAADRAGGAAAYEEEATFVRMALALLPEADPRQPRILARLGLALAWSLSLDEAMRVASEAGGLIAAAEGNDAAADYLADAADAVWLAGFTRHAWSLAEQGLRHVGSRRNTVWARFIHYELTRRDAADPDNPGIPTDCPERRELARVVAAQPDQEWMQNPGVVFGISLASRDEVLSQFGNNPGLVSFWAGQYREMLPVFRGRAESALEGGQIFVGVFTLTVTARLHSALGDLSASSDLYTRVTEIAQRVKPPPFLALQIGQVPLEYAFIRGEGFEAPLTAVIRGLEQSALENQWVMATMRSLAAALCARMGRRGEALRWAAGVVPAIDRAPGWVANYPLMLYMAVDALWALECNDHADLFEGNLRAKIIAPDFRYAHTDGRLALARLCALRGSVDEAAEWFARARTVLDEQGARPLRALVDFDEALTYARRGARGDGARARVLLGAALPRFAELGMTGWVRQAEDLRARCG